MKTVIISGPVKFDYDEAGAFDIFGKIVDKHDIKNVANLNYKGFERMFNTFVKSEMFREPKIFEIDKERHGEAGRMLAMKKMMQETDAEKVLIVDRDPYLHTPMENVADLLGLEVVYVWSDEYTT